MDSPIIKGIFSHIKLNSENTRAIYLQLSDEILTLIKHGKLTTGQKLPSTRDVASLLKINRSVDILKRLTIQSC